jgi:hypothetical protein
MKQKIARLGHLILACLVVILPANGGQSPRVATVHVILVNFYGIDVGTGSVSHFIEDNEGSKDLASTFENNTAFNVPFGKYHLRVFKENYYSTDRTVQVNQNELWVVVQLRVGEEDGPFLYTVSGRVEGLSSSRGAIWIRAQGLYSEIIADTRATKRGSF